MTSSSFHRPNYSHLLDDALRTYCIHEADTLGKVIALRARHGQGLFTSAAASKADEQSDSNDQMALSVFQFLSTVRFLVADGTELRSQVIRQQLLSIREGTVGKESRWESFVAFAGFRVGNELHRKLMETTPTAAASSRFIAVPSAHGVWAFHAIRCAMSYARKAMLDALDSMPLAPLHLLLGLLREEEAGPPTEPAASTLFRFIKRGCLGGAISNESDTNWCLIAAALAANVFSMYLLKDQGREVYRLADEVACWMQDTWDAMVTIVPRVGLSAHNSTTRRGVLVAALRNSASNNNSLYWASVKSCTDGSTMGSPDCPELCAMTPNPQLEVVPLPPESLFASERGLDIAAVVLLKDITIGTYPASRSMLYRVIHSSAFETLASVSSVIVVVVEDDVDSTTRLFLEGWPAVLLELLLGGGSTLQPPPRCGSMMSVVTITGVGKSSMFRLASSLQTAPMPCALLNMYETARLIDRKLGIAVRSLAQDLHPWSITVLLSSARSEDATTYASWHSRLNKSNHETLVLMDVQRGGEHKSRREWPFVSVVLCGPTPAVVGALSLHFHRHMSHLRCLFKGSRTTPLCCPGHGLPIAMCASACRSVAGASCTSSPLPADLVRHVSQWRKDHLGSQEEGTVHEEFLTDFRLVLPVVASALSDALESYLALLLQQSFGFTPDKAASRAWLAASSFQRCAAPPTTASSYRDLYTMFCECPPLFMGGTNADEADRCGGRSAEVSSLPTVTLAELHEWHSVKEVRSAIASMFRVAEAFSSVGTVTASA